jgi:C-type mannose receptor
LGRIVDTHEIQDEMFAIYEIIEPWADMDSTVSLDPDEIADFMEDHRNEVFCEIPLLNTDTDGDGWTTCDGDCNDSVEWAHPGAEEICGDDVDSDCDGSLDADWCGCQEFSRIGRNYLICPPTETWEEGKATCLEEGDGMDLAIINDGDEASWLSSRANNTLEQGYWIGLSDSDDEGTFTWVDGSALDYEDWATDEPNDLTGDNDCVQLLPDSQEWSDVACDQLLGVLCEQVD